jgi:hypothetical protein
MDAERPDDALTASPLDREIRAALAVDPSPEFVARVRTRLAHEPTARAWRRPWLVAAAGAVAAAIALAVVVSRPHDTTTTAPVTQSLKPAQVDRPAEPRPEPVVNADPEPVERRARGRAEATLVRPTAAAPESTATEPETLIDPREAIALRQLIAGTRDGSLHLSAALQSTTPTAMELPEVSDVVIAPITIEPLAPAAGAEGVRP